MIRVLLWLVLAFVAWSFWRSRQRADRGAPGGGAPRPAPPPPPAEAETMVDCARCGLHLPVSEAVSDAQGRLFCGSEHRSAGPASQ